MIEESNIVNRPTVSGNTSYAGVLKKGKNVTVFQDSMISGTKNGNLMIILKKMLLWKLLEE